jgi:hypothetical protein
MNNLFPSNAARAAAPQATTAQSPRFSFFKGGMDIIAPKDQDEFDWEQAAAKVREQLGDALNARNVSFLLGSGGSSFLRGNQQLGIPTMAPMAETFLAQIGVDEGENKSPYITQAERDQLQNGLGINLTKHEYKRNLERLMEVLFSAQLALKDATAAPLQTLRTAIDSAVEKVKRHVLKSCSEGAFATGDSTVATLYQTFYQKLIFRDRSLPRPWIFTTNYDLFNEVAMDRLGIPYCNGFSGAIERRFNPSVFRYSLAEQLDISSRKWTAVDNFVYLCKLHGSINWVEDGTTLFPIREMQGKPMDEKIPVLIYPTPVKQNASFGSPYADLFREFQKQIVHEQSVLFTIGYSFGDEHINNIIFQALTVPNFRLIAFLPPDAEGVPQKLRELADPRIWLIGGEGHAIGRRAEYFDTFIEKFMPEAPGNKIDSAISNVLTNLVNYKRNIDDGGGNGIW